MSIEALNGVNFSAADQPEMNADLREYLESWYRYQRHEFIRKLRDLTPKSIVAWSVPPVELSVLGLVRHMRNPVVDKLNRTALRPESQCVVARRRAGWVWARRGVAGGTLGHPG
jgi:Protein of unknown function (DUF664)